MKRLGFVIVNDLEEYLAVFQNRSNFSKTCWAKIPDIALIYPTRQKAISAIRSISTSHKLWVLSLYETATQFAVSALGDDVPPWIENIN